MKKSFKSLILFMAMTVLLVAMTVTASAENNEDYVYTVLENGTVEITRYIGSEDSPVIPTEIEGKRVTSIAANSFSYSDIKSIVISDSVESIGDSAFYDCLSLETVDLGDGIRSIEDSAFYGCYNLKAVDLGNGVRSIGEYAFSNTDIRSIVIPDSVNSIGEYAFSDCLSLEAVNLGDGIRTIGSDAFAWCYSLKTLDIGKSLEAIEGHLFFSSFALEKITVDPENETFYSDEYGVLYNKETKALITYPASAPMTSYKIMEGTQIIGENAFHDSMFLKELSFPESLHTIEMGAFGFASGIETFTIPETVKYVGEGAFGYCFALKEVYVLNPDIEFDGMIYASNGIIADGVTSLDIAELLKEKEIARRNGDEKKWKELDDKFYTYLIVYDDYFTDAITIYCHDDGQEYTAEGQREFGTPVVRYHTYAEEWTYDWENYVRYRECTFENCDARLEEALEREETGDVEIVAPVDPDTDFEVDNVEKDSDSYILVQDALSETDYTLLKAFDITLKNKDGVHVQPDGTVKVKLPLDWEKNGSYKVYRVNEDGTLTDMNAYRQGSHMVFETDHFSIYIIVEDMSAEAPEEPSTPDTPEKKDLISKIFDLFSDLINLLISLFSNVFN